MQAIRNKFHGKSKRNSLEKNKSVTNNSYVDPTPSLPGGVVTEFHESHQDLPSGTHVDHYEKKEVSMTPSFSSSSIPVPPPMPPADFWRRNLESYNGNYDHFFMDTPRSNSYSNFNSGMDSLPTQSMRTTEVLPVEVIEKPVVIHESIRQEQVEEIQPVVRVEREKTEIRQITQPLTDKEIRPVMIEERTLPVEVLPTIINETAPRAQIMDQSTRDFDTTLRQVVEKAPIIQETEKWRIIEEVQPIIYREVVVPHVIRTSRPMREVIVEAPIYTEQTLQVRDLSAMERQRWSNFFTRESLARESMPATSIPVMSIPDPVSLPIRSMDNAQHHKKEIIEEVVTTTTTTSAAPVVGGSSSGANRSSSNLSSNFNNQPVVLNETHETKLGPLGEKITKDSITTTSSQTLNPTRAN